MPRKKKTEAEAAKAKADAAEVAIRVEEVLQIILDGAAYPDVVQYSAEKQWGIQERQIRNYMSRAYELLTERQEKKRGRLIAIHTARREKLYARSVNAADYRTALAVLADLAKLQNLYASDKDLKKLVKLATVQAERLKALESQLSEVQRADAPARPNP